MNRTNNCGELSKANINQNVKLSGWVNKVREKGFIIWIDIRDRYGVTQLVFDKERSSEELFDACLLYTSDADDECFCVYLGGRRLI